MRATAGETYSLALNQPTEAPIIVRRERSPIISLVESSGAEKIVEKATRLFAEHGYHGVTTRQIALATGLNVATIYRHVGTKRELYRLVVERLYREDRAIIEAWLARFPVTSIESLEGTREVITRLTERIFQRIEEQPILPRLHLHRWFDPPDALTPLESELYLKLYRPMVEFLERMRQRGIVTYRGDFRDLLRSFDWIVVGYFVAGPMSAKQFRTDPLNPESLARIKAFVLDYLFQMLGLNQDNSNH